MKQTDRQKAISKNVANAFLPTWVSYIFTFLAICLVPWTIYLAYTLPRHSIVHNWDTTWVGLDIGIMLLLLLTGLFAALKSKWIILTLASVSSFLIVDAWFDIQSSHAGLQQKESIIIAIFVELPLSFLGYKLAYLTIKNLTK